jgi:hypothetical protein
VPEKKTSSLHRLPSLSDAVELCAPKPPDDVKDQSVKKRYSERLSAEVAKVLAARLRALGVPECQPDEEKGKERQFAGGIGAKKVDVSFATEVGGLILGISVKSICFPDNKTKNFAKNLTNRRGDMLAEATTLHQRFPYAVLGGLFLFEGRADADATDKRISTFQRAREIFRFFTSRDDRSNSVEKYEVMAVAKFSPAKPYGYLCYLADGSPEPVEIDVFLKLLLTKVAERNPDNYRFAGERLEKS